MLTISVEFLHGIVRAGSADDTALTGDGGAHEWPPSPARLFAALVSGAGTRARLPERVGTLGLTDLEGLIPDIYASSPSETLVSDLRDRFVVVDERNAGSVQEYPARQAQRLSPGVRIAPAKPKVAYVWANLELSDDAVESLRYRAARVPYLGCADSPVSMSVHTTAQQLDLPRWEPDTEGSVALPVPPVGFIDDLDDRYDQWVAGAVQRRHWYRTPMANYRSPEDRNISAGPAPVTLWVRFDRPVGYRRCVDVAETLRNAVLTHVEDLMGDRAAVPEILHGHVSGRGPGFHTARWVPLPTVAVPHADGKIRGACIWMPPEVGDQVADLARTALTRIIQLTAPGRFSVGVTPFDGTAKPWSSHPKRWEGPSRHWVSATPVVHERYTHTAPTLEEVARWCHHAGLPAPESIRVSSVPIAAGSRRISAHESSRRGQLRGPRSFIEMRFAEPVHGPVIIGRGRGFGLGLFAPLREQTGST
jgi:CRISPR-associated protein Csb2